jgi:hypothetical protein
MYESWTKSYKKTFQIPSRRRKTYIFLDMAKSREFPQKCLALPLPLPGRGFPFLRG